MGAKENAEMASLENTDARIDKVLRRQDRDSRINNLVTVTGYDPKLGMIVGKQPDGSEVKFKLATNDVPAIGRNMEAARARGSSFGYGDLKPLVN